MYRWTRLLRSYSSNLLIIMKKIITLLLLLPFLIFSQVPQGVGYQGVATDAAGFELINQSISIRASVISGSATGTIEWQEIHNTFTDTFGLFNLTIGQGTSTGNGAQTSFADITWGANTHFLKIEMDVNGGTNYSHMGTNQMMSVPYALYAENANINYDSIATILSNDSSFSNIFGTGCTSFGISQNTFNFNWTSNSQTSTYFEEAWQDGFFGGQMNCGTTYQGVFEVWDDTTSSSPIYKYNISNGVSTFLIPIKRGQFFKINGFCINVDFFIPLECEGSSSSIVDSSYIDSLVQFYSSGNGGGCDWQFPYGKNGDFFTAKLDQSVYTVPVGKVCLITHFESDGVTADLRTYFSNSYRTLVVGATQNVSEERSIVNPIILSENEEVFSDNGNINGILFDENTNIDPITFGIWLSSDYIVPQGKKLIILNAKNVTGGIYLSLNGNRIFDGYGINNVLKNPIFCDQLDTLSSNDLTMINGYLVDENYFADCGGGGSSIGSNSSSSLNDSVYFGSVSLIQGPSYPISSDTITIPYIEGRDIFITSSNLIDCCGGNAALRIVDDNGVDISAKVNGSKTFAQISGIPISSISGISTSSNNNMIQAIIRPYNIDSSYLKIFFDDNGGLLNGPASGSISFQY